MASAAEQRLAPQVQVSALRMQRDNWGGQGGGGGYGRNDRDGGYEQRSGQGGGYGERGQMRFEPKSQGSGQREAGVAARWNAKGFGFIEPDSGGEVPIFQLG